MEDQTEKGSDEDQWAMTEYQITCRRNAGHAFFIVKPLEGNDKTYLSFVRRSKACHHIHRILPSLFAPVASAEPGAVMCMQEIRTASFPTTMSSLSQGTPGLSGHTGSQSAPVQPLGGNHTASMSTLTQLEQTSIGAIDIQSNQKTTCKDAHQFYRFHPG